MIVAAYRLQLLQVGMVAISAEVEEGALRRLQAHQIRRVPA